jgi:hypothetical protein
MPSPVILDEYANLDWVNVDSSNIRRIAFVKDFGRLWVEFYKKPGSKHHVYYYLSVTPAMWAEFQAAPSKGKWLHTNIKLAGYGYEPVF